MLTLIVAMVMTVMPDKPVLPKGHVPYAIKLDGTPANGFLLPGGKVDVLLVETVDKGKAKGSVVIEDQLIVAVDTVADPAKKETLITVTLAVKPETAKSLIVAEKKGQLRLVLRAAPEE